MDQNHTTETGTSNLTAIRTYFQAPPRGRKVSMDELKALTNDERKELGEMAKEALEKGWE